jgi:hypothetical protein
MIWVEKEIYRERRKGQRKIRERKKRQVVFGDRTETVTWDPRITVDVY